MSENPTLKVQTMWQKFVEYLTSVHRPGVAFALVGFGIFIAYIVALPAATQNTGPNAHA